MVVVEQVATLQDLDGLRQEYIESLAGPLEPFLEELISYSRLYYRLVQGGQPIGYFCVSTKGTLLQFYLKAGHIRSLQSIFSRLLSQGFFTQALVSTRDRLGISSCLEFHKEVSVDDYLFEDGSGPVEAASEWQDSVFALAGTDDIPLIRSVVNDFHDFLHYTLEGSVAEQSIFLLLDGNTLLGTGVIASKEYQPPYVDIGMCVNEQYRRQQVGTEIIRRLRLHCRERALIPLASCRFDNLASKKTLEKAGMVSRDRVLRIKFQA